MQKPRLTNTDEIIWKKNDFGQLDLTVKKIDWDIDTYFLQTWLPNIAHTVRGSHALWPRFTRIHLSPERNAFDLWTRMKRAVFLQTYQSGFYSYDGAQDLRLFETGIATVTTQVLSSSRRIVAQLAEPILVYSLNEYINQKAPDEMAVYLKQRLADAPGPEAQGKVWEQSVPNALHSLFKTSSTADNIQWSNSSYQHQSHNFYFVHQPTKHLTFSIDSRFTDLSFADWLENPSMSAFFSLRTTQVLMLRLLGKMAYSCWCSANSLNPQMPTRRLVNQQHSRESPSYARIPCIALERTLRKLPDRMWR